MENRKLYTACQGKIPLRPLRTIAGAIEQRRQNRRESEDNTMSIFKKPEKGFLAKLFKHKQVEELAEELAHTYADEMQADMLCGFVGKVNLHTIIFCHCSEDRCQLGIVEMNGLGCFFLR